MTKTTNRFQPRTAALALGIAMATASPMMTSAMAADGGATEDESVVVPAHGAVEEQDGGPFALAGDFDGA